MKDIKQLVDKVAVMSDASEGRGDEWTRRDLEFFRNDCIDFMAWIRDYLTDDEEIKATIIDIFELYHIDHDGEWRKRLDD